MKTTLYNHITLGTEVKPLIKNLELKLLCEQIKRGELFAYEEAIEYYTFEKGQRSLLDSIYYEKTK
jgi:hypothetical protein